MAVTECALTLEVARDGRQDWCRIISFVNDSSIAEGDRVFGGRNGGRQHAIQ